MDDDEPDGDNVPKTPQYHPGVDDGFFPDIGPRVGDDDPKRDIPPNGDVPFGRRPSVNNFPFAPGFNVSLPKSGIVRSFVKIYLFFSRSKERHKLYPM